MSFLRRNQDLAKKAATGIVALVVIRVAVGLLMGDNADKPMPTGGLIALSVVIAPILLVTVLGFWIAARRTLQRVSSTTMSLRTDLAWPPVPAAQIPSEVNTDRDDLAAAGFRHGASIDVVSNEGADIWAVSVSHDRQIIVVKSPTSFELISDFGGRPLTTSTRLGGLSAESEFHQEPATQDLTAALQTHQTALEVANESASPATRFDFDAAAGYVLALEADRLSRYSKTRYLSLWVQAIFWPHGVFSERPLTNNAHSRSRVEHWASR